MPSPPPFGVRAPLASPRLAIAAVTVVVGVSGSAHAQSSPPSPVASLTLAQVVALAKDHAPSVHAALARIASADAAVDRARAPLFPSLYAQGGGTAFGTNGQVYASGVISSAASETYFLGQGSLNLQWTLYDFGHTSSAIDGAKAGVTSATLSAKATEQIAMAEAAVAFFTLLADDDLIRSAELARADREHVLEITHHLVEGGYRSPVDETRAQIALDVAKLDVTVATGTRDSDSVNLATALILDPATTFHLTAPTPLHIDDAAARDGEVALRTRRDVAAAAARVDQARHNVASAKRAHLPVLAVSATGQLLYAHDISTYTGVGGGTVVTDGPTELAQGSLTLTVPIFDSLVNANVRGAEGGLSEAQAGLEQVTLAARSEVLQASRQARSARVVLEQSERLAAGTGANLKAVEDRYATGMESPLTLADAQREDANARVAIVRAQLAYDVAAVRLLAGLSRADELLKAR
ncbi:MAG: TolC family protein [Polyangiaceae bacterium]